MNLRQPSELPLLDQFVRLRAAAARTRAASGAKAAALKSARRAFEQGRGDWNSVHLAELDYVETQGRAIDADYRYRKFWAQHRQSIGKNIPKVVNS